MPRKRERDPEEPRNYSIAISKETFPVFVKLIDIANETRESLSGIIFKYAALGLSKENKNGRKI